MHRKLGLVAHPAGRRRLLTGLVLLALASSLPVAASATRYPSTVSASPSSNAVVGAVMYVDVTAGPAEGRTTPWPTGSVTLYLDDREVGTAPGHYHAFRLRASAGTHRLRASYSGDENYEGANSAEQSLTVSKLAAQVLVGLPVGDRWCDAGPKVDGPSVRCPTVNWDQELVLSTQVRGPHPIVEFDPPVPGGTVEFFDNGVSIGQVALARGRAELPPRRLGSGFHSITVTYGGDASYEPQSQNRLQASFDVVGGSARYWPRNAPAGSGSYAIVFSDGSNRSFGDQVALSNYWGYQKPVVAAAAAAAPSYPGYTLTPFLTSADGKVGQMRDILPAPNFNQPVVGIAPSPLGTNAYWLVARECGIFTHDAP